ncbi:hypothetical protein K438DRAFT_1972683 [Mycena galopus ATCC 62051]|nr:hypothetical protein K438DRAFT_1972683 [Mycena galopus ATCC 62051]
MKWAAWAEYGFDHEMRIINRDDEMAVAGKYPKKGFTINCFEAAQNNCVIPALDAKHFPTANDSDREELAQGALQIESWTEAERAMRLEDQGDIPLIVTSSGIVLCKVSDSEKWAKAVAAQEAREEKARARAKAKTKMKTKTKTTGKAAKKDGVAAPGALKTGDARATGRAVAIPPSGSHTRSPSPSRSHTRSPSPSRSHARSPSSSPPHAPARDAEDPAPAAASSRISQEEKARLHAVYDRAQDKDREAQDDLRIKFRLQRNGDESPIMYGALVPLKKGDEHHAGEELTWFFDKNFAHWNPLPNTYGD